MAITPFHLDIPQEQLDDLRARLARVRWPDDVPGGDHGDDWRYGPPLAHVRDLVEHALHRYDWRAQEARLRAFPQFTTEIDGQRVHFLHVRSSRPDALPLIVTHGWPSSPAEYLDVIAPLTEPEDGGPAFHLVIPSPPGYGLSGPTREFGWGSRRIAETWAELMARLGYRRFGAQGGDWGTWISRELALVAPESVVGVHTNGMITFPSGDPEELAGLSAADQERMAGWQRYTDELYGYKLIQSTKPQALAYALADSPVGLLGWFSGVFREWTDPRTPLAADLVLTHALLYWFTGTANSAARSFVETPDDAEHAEREGVLAELETGAVPHGVAVFPHDVLRPVRPFAERINNVVRWTEHDRGGTFPAAEVPELFTADVRAFFAAVTG